MRLCLLLLFLAGCSRHATNELWLLHWKQNLQAADPPPKREWTIHIAYPVDATNYSTWYLQGSGDGKTWTNIATFGRYNQTTNWDYNVKIPTNGVALWRMKGVK